MKGNIDNLLSLLLIIATYLCLLPIVVICNLTFVDILQVSGYILLISINRGKYVAIFCNFPLKEYLEYSITKKLKKGKEINHGCVIKLKSRIIKE